MWFKNLSDSNWWHVSEILYFFVVQDGTTWDIKFLNIAAGTITYQTGYASKPLAQTALDALIATFTV